MKNSKRFLMLIAILGLTFYGLQAQESVNISGGDAAGSGGKVAYSIGQVVYTTIYGEDGKIFQGVQQPYEILEVSAIEELNENNYNISVFPNPTSDLITISIEGMDNPYAELQVYDMMGKLLMSKTMSDTQTQLDFNNLTPATYFVKIMLKEDGIFQQDVRVFKVKKI